MNERVPTATERIGERLRSLRTSGAWDQTSVADVLTALGSPTKPSTVTRIEGGTQPPTVEQALLLALVMGFDGLRELLAPPFTLGDLTISTEADLDWLLTGHRAVPTLIPTVQSVGVVGVVAEHLDGVMPDQRDRAIGKSLHVEPAAVTEASERLYGRRAQEEIVVRFSDRLIELGTPVEPESPQWRAYRSHAVRAVTKEIGEAL